MLFLHAGSLQRIQANHHPNLRALFLAGSNGYKESREMAEIAAAGKAHGLWLHRGAVQR